MSEHKKTGLVLSDALPKVLTCFLRQANEKEHGACYHHGLEPGKCDKCEFYVSPAAAWMLLAAQAQVSVQGRS